MVDGQSVVVGEVTRADSLAWALESLQDERTLAEALAGRELVHGYPDELASQIADRMALSGAGRVPIVDRASGRLLGIVGRKDLFRSRARRLREESQRTAFFRRAPATRA
ncbi:CBS domain protein [compost metagenome]